MTAIPQLVEIVTAADLQAASQRATRCNSNTHRQ
jgi:hypothetical protein